MHVSKVFILQLSNLLITMTMCYMNILRLNWHVSWRILHVCMHQVVQILLIVNAKDVSFYGNVLFSFIFASDFPIHLVVIQVTQRKGHTGGNIVFKHWLFTVTQESMLFVCSCSCIHKPKPPRIPSPITRLKVIDLKASLYPHNL